MPLTISGRESGARGPCSATASSETLSTPRAAKRPPSTYGSQAITFVSSAATRRANALPMLPSPPMPTVSPWSEPVGSPGTRPLHTPARTSRSRVMILMINLPFGRGRLFQAVQGKALPPWANSFDCASWAQFFLRYIVSHPAVTCCVPGTAKVDYLLDNLGAAQGRLPDAATRRRMEEFIDKL